GGRDVRTSVRLDRQVVAGALEEGLLRIEYRRLSQTHAVTNRDAGERGEYAVRRHRADGAVVDGQRAVVGVRRRQKEERAGASLSDAEPGARDSAGERGRVLEVCVANRDVVLQDDRAADIRVAAAHFNRLRATASRTHPDGAANVDRR